MGSPDPAVIDAASLGEVAWVDDAGAPRAAGVLPLLRGGAPVLALTLDRADLAVALAGAGSVAVLVREPRSTGRGWQPAGWRCRTRLVEDLDGEVYVDELLVQELRRYPPARKYADSPLLMREHWWFLPRLLVELEPVSPLPAPAPREAVSDLLLVAETDGAPVVSGVWAESGRLEHTWGPLPEPGPGVVLGQDASFPDLERWDTWTRPVGITSAGVVAPEPLPDPGPVGVPGLWARWRAERRFADRCRRGLAAWQG